MGARQRRRCGNQEKRGFLQPRGLTWRRYLSETLRSGPLRQQVDGREDHRAGHEESDDEQLGGRRRTPRQGESCEDAADAVEGVLRGPVLRIGIVFCGLEV